MENPLKINLNFNFPHLETSLNFLLNEMKQDNNYKFASK